MKKEIAIIFNPNTYVLLGLFFLVLSMVNDLFVLSLHTGLFVEVSFGSFVIAFLLYLIPEIFPRYRRKKNL